MQPVLALKAAVAATNASPGEARNWVAKMNAERAVGNAKQALADAQHAADLDPEIVQVLPAVQRVLEQGLTSKWRAL
jgi:hypothetical protein